MILKWILALSLLTSFAIAKDKQAGTVKDSAAQVAMDKATLRDVRTSDASGVFTAEYIFDEKIFADDVKVDFINETIQLEIPNAFVKGTKDVSIENPLVKSIYNYQVGSSTMRSRIIYKGISASTYKGQVRTLAEGNRLKVMIGEEVVPAAKVSVESTPTSFERADEKPIQVEKIVASAEKQKTNGKSDNKKSESTATDTLKENEIPINLEVTKKAEESGGSAVKYLMVLAVMGMLFGGGYVFSKKYLAKANSKTAQTQIKVLSQHYLGPKKSLAIIRVAGESILIGVTDQNISMIKSLSLLDEEIPVETPSEFSKVLTEKGVDFEDSFSLSGIKDVVSNKLKGMRTL